MSGRRYSAAGDAIASEKPVAVRRYRAFTRLNHWVMALSMILLILSGFALFEPSLFFLTGIFGGGQTARWLHPFLGLVLFLSFLSMFIQLWRLNLPAREDGKWLANLDAVIKGEEERLPELGKYNAGQKVVFWGMAGLILVMLVTGAMMWVEYVPLWAEYAPALATIPARRIALALHALAAFGTVMILIVHIYAAFWTRGTLSAMTRGTVSGGWAFRHHRKWFRELAKRAGNRAGPAE